MNDDTTSGDADEAMGGDAASALVGLLKEAGATVVIEEDEE